ncbi:unnamed protein product [Miscanthus lutarioriparius]|uniref:Uncharacterized protein n=1 Tax=Miscanthus lutarioriparius TaxID=422564 RepID=A0A811RHH7_9POAL|nr:unnamed protein product [Miscanthus lutarioriparius]
MLRRRHQRLPLCLAHAHFRVLSAQGMAAAAGALHAQCLHGNVELAVVIVQKLMALDPSNHDAEDGNWQADVTMDRCEVMLEAGIKKTAARHEWIGSLDAILPSPSQADGVRCDQRYLDMGVSSNSKHCDSSSGRSQPIGRPPPWWLGVGFDLAQATTMAAWDGTTLNVLHSERREGDEVARRHEKARFAA